MLVVGGRPAEATFPGPNGKIAYSAFDGDDSEIYTIKATGGKPFQVTHNHTADWGPSYSPDGKKIAYAGHDREGATAIFTIHVGGGGQRNLTDNENKDDF
jgi:TolB protein